MSHPSKTLRISMILSLALVAASCASETGGSGNSEGDRQIEVCSLITASEAQTWLSGPVEPPAPSDGPDPETTCVYKSTGAQTQILLQVYDGAQYYGGNDAELHPDANPVAIGEQGYTEPGSVGFLQSGWTVSISRISGPVTEESLLAAAQTVSGRLP